MTSSWEDLPDDELVTKLTQHGVPLSIAAGWVRHRDDEPDASMITRALNGGWP